jgi:hypothetical protein
MPSEKPRLPLATKTSRIPQAKIPNGIPLPNRRRRLGSFAKTPAVNNGWRHAATLILEQTDVATVSHQLHRALFLDAKLDLRAMRE